MTAITLLLEALATLFGGAFLLRAYTNYQGIPLQGPVGRLVAGLTDWAVLPLRRVLPRPGRWDLASLLLAVLVKAIQFGVLAILLRSIKVWLVLTPVGLVQLACTLITVFMIVYALASWIRVDPAVHDWLRRVCAPLLAPVQRLLPRLGGVDLSPLVWTLAAQVLSRSLDYWQSLWLVQTMMWT